MLKNPTNAQFIATPEIRQASTQKSTSFLDVRAHARRVEELYATNNLLLSQNSSLGILIANAKALADREEAGRREESTMNDVFSSLHLERIAGSVLQLGELEGRERYLRSLMSGEMDFFVRSASHAKNIFWEVELFNTLLSRWPKTVLVDPPDITLEVDGGCIAIPCKKIYSEENFEKVLSNAVHQVERGFDAGIVAINIDDLTPAGTVLRAKSREEMNRFLANQTNAFIRRHQRHFRKYLAGGRLVSALVTLNVTVDILDGKPRFITAREMTFWTIPGLSAEKMALVEQVRDIVLGDAESKGVVNAQ